MKPLEQLKSLIQLLLTFGGEYINPSRVSDLKVLEQLKRLTQLTLDLSYSQVSDLKPLEQLKGLTQLTLSLNDRVSGFELVTKMTGLQKLSIANATKAQRMSLHKIPASLVELKF